MIKIIFLDIDGVIATPETITDCSWGLTFAKQLLLKQIIDHTRAKIVLSSSWRTNNLITTKEYMKSAGFILVDEIIGITIRAYHYIEKGIHLSIPRGVEIQQWIDTNIHSNNGKEWARKELGKDWNYIILDDNSDMLLEHKDHFIQCNSLIGLTLEHVEQAIKILNYEKN